MKMKKKKTRFTNGLHSLGKAFLLMLLLGLCQRAMAQEFSITRAAADPSEDGVQTTFTVTRTGNQFTLPEIQLVLSGTSTMGDDFQTFETTFQLARNPFHPQGTNSRNFNLVIEDDNLVEGLEDLTITLALTPNSQGATISVANGAVSFDIADNDTGTFTLTMTDGDAAEEGTDRGRYIIALDKENGTGQAVTIPYNLTGTATNPEDYTVGGQAVLSFPAGVTQRALNINVVDDNEPEPDETVILTLGQPSNNTLFTFTQIPAADRTVVITDNDCVAGDAPPTINGNATEFCSPPNNSVNLNSYVQGNAPAGSTLRWSVQANPTGQGQLLPANPSISDSGTYYALYWANDNSCASPSSAVTVTFTAQPSAGTTTDAIACNNPTDEFGPVRIDLDNLITGADAGDWSQTGGPNINIPNSHNLDFRNQAAGVYEFTYTTNPSGACGSATSTVKITVDDCDPCEAGDAAPALNNNVPTTSAMKLTMVFP